MPVQQMPSLLAGAPLAHGSAPPRCADAPPAPPPSARAPPPGARGAHPSPPTRGAPGVSGSPGGSERECPRAGPANRSSGSYLGGWVEEGWMACCRLATPTGTRAWLAG